MQTHGSTKEVETMRLSAGTVSRPAANSSRRMGKKVFSNRKLGNCLACHQVTKLSAHPFHGEIGPSLDGVAERYEEPQLRLQVVNAKEINPDTIMPAFYRTEGLHRVLKNFQGKPVLTAEQVEDVVAYLKTLK